MLPIQQAITKDETELLEVLSKAINNLLSQRKRDSSWEDVRSTSLAVWALNECLRYFEQLPQSDSYFEGIIKETNNWLSKRQKRDKLGSGYSWESEAWDTSLSIIALSYDDTYSDYIERATRWLNHIKDKKTGVWYDEVWESILSTIALLRSQRINKMPIRYDDWSWIEKVFKWLLEIPPKSTGEFVCPHYSGFLVWLLGEVQNSPASQQITKSIVFRKFKARAEGALKWILMKLDDDGKNLWGPYTFSTSYIVIGLCSLNIQLNPQQVHTLVHWFEISQCKEKKSEDYGGFEDTEDTSLAILALSALVKETGLNKKDFKTQINQPITRKQCFLGYSGKTTSIALELKEHISLNLPQITIIDWRLNFRLGHILFEEIKKACDECQAAVFLITKDDKQIDSLKSFRKTPRDNIILEVGYFSAKIGNENTILVVEKGAELPTDLGGILYIPMPDRKKIDAVKIAIVKKLKEILHK